MTTYREGQLVRWEWPDGTGCTDTLASGLRGRRFGLEPHQLIRDGRTVTILAEPKPDEPKGVGAVVRGPGGERDLWVRVHAGSDKPWHEVLPGTYEEHDACRRTWDQIEVVEVLSPGVDVDALDVIDVEVL